MLFRRWREDRGATDATTGGRTEAQAAGVPSNSGATGEPGGGAAGAQDAHAGGLRRLRLRFVGQVQGVGFRWTSLGVARDLGLTGWVRNEADGSVSMELQGEPSHVGAFFSQMLEAYRRYPIRYTVDEREDIPVVPGEDDFQVRR